MSTTEGRRTAARCKGSGPARGAGAERRRGPCGGGRLTPGPRSLPFRGREPGKGRTLRQQGLPARLGPERRPASPARACGRRCGDWRRMLSCPQGLGALLRLREGAPLSCRPPAATPGHVGRHDVCAAKQLGLARPGPRPGDFAACRRDWSLQPSPCGKWREHAHLPERAQLRASLKLSVGAANQGRAVLPPCSRASRLRQRAGSLLLQRQRGSSPAGHWRRVAASDRTSGHRH